MSSRSSPRPSPPPTRRGWASCAPAARSRIRSHLKGLAQNESRELGEKLLAQALRAEGVGQPPGHEETDKPLWDKLLRFTGNRTREEMMTDIGLGKRSA